MKTSTVTSKICNHCDKKITITERTRIFSCKPCRTQIILVGKINKLELLQTDLIKDVYSRYLFQLYLNYIKRYKLKSPIFNQAKNLLSYLTVTKVTPFQDWKAILEESHKYSSSYTDYKRVTGCPIIKIGRMLTEIGVMKARSEDISHYFVYILKKYPKTLKEHVNTFLKDEKKKNIQDKTIIMRLEIFLNLVKWYSPVDAEKFNISAVNESDIESFFIHLIEKGHQQAYIYHAFINLSIFFRWCLVQKIILSNPCSKHKTSKPPQQVTVCDNDVVNKIMRFIKNPNSDPQMAMTLLLILVWGLKSEDLSHAKIEI